ncbi:MAG: M1 family aminopeptidase, partial [Phycisphaerae bacterium]
VYSDTRISAELFGEKTSWLDWWGASAGGVGMHQAACALDSRRDDGSIADPTFAHWHRSVGFNLAYDKPSLVLWTLENYLGRERFDRIMRTYFERWKFRHPCRNDFIAVANEVAGENLDWFFDQLIGQPTSLDYAVASIANVPVDTLDEGLSTYEFRAAEDDRSTEEDDEDVEEDEDHKPHQSTVVFRRVGEVIFPMEVLIEFSDGEVVRETWDGRDRVKIYRFTRPAKVVRAAIDPDHKVPLDVDPLNNSRRIEENENELVKNKYTLKGFFWMQSLLQLFSIFG